MRVPHSLLQIGKLFTVEIRREEGSLYCSCPFFIYGTIQKLQTLAIDCNMRAKISKLETISKTSWFRNKSSSFSMWVDHTLINTSVIWGNYDNIYFFYSETEWFHESQVLPKVGWFGHLYIFKGNCQIGPLDSHWYDRHEMKLKVGREELKVFLLWGFTKILKKMGKHWRFVNSRTV